jgi:hypothetical protein
METFYRQAYRVALPADEGADPADEAGLGPRLRRLMEAALGVVEGSFGIEPRGDLTERCRRLEQAGWDRLYPTIDGQPVEAASPLQRGLADRLAEETERRMWHMRLVESFVAVSGSYVQHCPSQERFADTLLLLWDTLCRIRGGNPAERPRLGRRRVRLRIDAPLDVTERLADYRSDRRGAVASLTEALQGRLEALIQPSGGPGIPAGNRR